MKYRRIRFLLIILMLLAYRQNYAQRFFETETVEEADITVAVVFEVQESDLKVCFVYNENEATTPGKWMEVAEAENADIKIIFLDEPEKSMLKLFIVDNCNEAGWNKPGKENLLKFKNPQ